MYKNDRLGLIVRLLAEGVYTKIVFGWDRRPESRWGAHNDRLVSNNDFLPIDRHLLCRFQRLRRVASPVLTACF